MCIVLRGRVIRELNLRRTDLIITTKIFFGTRKGPNDTGLSRKQWVPFATTPQSAVSCHTTRVF